MTRLRKLDLHSIWRSTCIIDKKEYRFKMSFKSDLSLGSLWYSIDDSDNEIASGAVDFIDNGDDTYQLSIGDSVLNIRLYMPSEDDPTFDMNIPGYGQLSFSRLRGKI